MRRDEGRTREVHRSDVDKRELEGRQSEENEAGRRKDAKERSGWQVCGGRDMWPNDFNTDLGYSEDKKTPGLNI